ncbi:ATP-binding protein [Thermobifida cellulosilytica]|uniref:Histidine kinase/HSP90-like ATPase domain-containing protein n=1 Tax=Thermobifida cellulosilytica TB100 TaxID=665004 RepID=A0A147KEB9_THECS|nr:ATP-binding protein [Thermobifida cellulosilytica]KUP95625.1 hypothetical protein AC529_16620 [Thermobifida cellulosilytica TB100]
MTDTTDDPGPGPGRLRAVSEFWELPGDPAFCPDLRRRVRDRLAGFPRVVGDAELVAAELFANACRHTRSGQGGTVTVSLSALHTGLVLITVADQGPRTDPRTGRPRVPQPRPPDDPLTADGRGLRLVAALTTDWGHWTTRGGGHSVWAVFAPPLPSFVRPRRPRS